MLSTTNNTMTNEEIKKMADSAIHWASGSWGQGQFDRPKYDDLTMSDLWYEIAKIANKNSQKHMDSHFAKAKAVLLTNKTPQA